MANTNLPLHFDRTAVESEKRAFNSEIERQVARDRIGDQIAELSKKLRDAQRHEDHDLIAEIEREKLRLTKLRRSI